MYAVVPMLKFLVGLRVQLSFLGLLQFKKFELPSVHSKKIIEQGPCERKYRNGKRPADHFGRARSVKYDIDDTPKGNGSIRY